MLIEHDQVASVLDWHSSRMGWMGIAMVTPWDLNFSSLLITTFLY